ncbi:hypothetical protein E3D03_000285 [Paracoccus sp. DMF]|nr:hypothetical protein [Paracoccus sp. DMF]MCV2445694.1 hypothetical protein [Paracoccus sp. DMF]
MKQEEPDDCLDGNAVHIVRWPGIEEWFKVLFAHHGQPIAEPPESWATAAFNDPIDYSWKASERQMGRAMSRNCRGRPTRAGSAAGPSFCGLAGAGLVEAKASKGMTGDPWAPVHVSETKALTLGERGWTYKLICELHFSGTWGRPLLAEPGGTKGRPTCC